MKVLGFLYFFKASAYLGLFCKIAIVIVEIYISILSLSFICCLKFQILKINIFIFFFDTILDFLKNKVLIVLFNSEIGFNTLLSKSL
jgi:hypothetical protein